MTAAPVLHVPDEPTVRAEGWMAAVLDGRELERRSDRRPRRCDRWLWSRWRSLAVSRLGQDDFGRIVLGYRREIWLWLAGERTWAQCCSGLIGRINRRLAGGGDPAPGEPTSRPLPLSSAASPSGARECPCCGASTGGLASGSVGSSLVRTARARRPCSRWPRARLWPTAGTVEVLGSRLGRVDVRTLRPRVALVSGAVTRQLRADMAARDVVVSGRHGALETWWNLYSDQDWDKADPLLALGGVAAIGGRPFGVISEGERQQVLLARALMSDPELILLDEPFAGLDLGARERLLVRLGALAADRRQPTDRPGHAPLRGDSAGFHPCRAGLTGRADCGGAAARCHHFGERLGLLRCGGDGGVHRRTVVEPRRLRREPPEQGRSEEALDPRCR